MSNEKELLRILWHSVAAFVKSGYGNVTRNVTSRIIQRGYNVFVSAYYGLEPGGTMKIEGVPHLPSKIGQFGKVSCQLHAKRLRPDMCILHTDWWAFPWFPKMPFINVLYSPQDHTNYPEELINLTKEYNYVLALCKFQMEELKNVGIDSYYVPHGVDVKTYHPIPIKEARKETRFPPEAVVIGRVAANSDKEDRKSWARCFVALRLFFDNNPDARKDIFVYCHTNPTDTRGLPLPRFVHKQGLDEIVRFTDPVLSHIRLTDEEMCLMYNSFDFQLYPSKREGFGLPIMESNACGRPNIVTDFSSMSEMVDYGKCGWLVKNFCSGENILTTAINACTALPDVYSIADTIEDAYNHPKKIITFGNKARKLAMDYDWDRVVENYWIPFLEEVPKLEQKKRNMEDKKKQEEFRKLYKKIKKKQIKKKMKKTIEDLDEVIERNETKK